ncbi:hypothetical protein ATY41_08260 [Leifsonia xyli subsp. xyli]|uniref:Anthranilate synthase component I N-terminal domain-containing protein n=1 Tax=Leifsonia xyli subsp. xyli TaxID=59736 RepID=A0A1E2SLX0_LEIXY|nr:hypothetical protein [Leifsonia xyli]ODA90767.1 hypothetical protein ATY41_08260 [Leifsonia xyli subsp. xyli]
MSDTVKTPSRINIGLLSESIDVDDPFAAFLALRSVYGDDEVALLESLGGPGIDNTSALIQFGLVVEIRIAARRIDIAGVSGVRARLLQRLLHAQLIQVESDGHRMADTASVWDVARACQLSFDAPDSSAMSFDVGFSAVLAYEIAAETENLTFANPATDDTPDIVLRLYSSTIEYDLATRAA